MDKCLFVMHFTSAETFQFISQNATSPVQSVTVYLPWNLESWSLKVGGVGGGEWIIQVNKDNR